MKIMKRTIGFLGCCLIMATAFSQDYARLDKGKAIDITIEFMSQLKKNQTFSYNDEIKYFGGELTAYSATILMQLGYINEQGNWIKPKPKISFLCELIRMNRNMILLEKSKVEYCFAGIPRQFSSSDNSWHDWIFAFQTVYVQAKTSMDENVGDIKMIIFFFRAPQQGLDFPIFVDGKPLADLLGFEHIDISNIAKRIPRLKKYELSKLIEHIKHLAEE